MTTFPATSSPASGGVAARPTMRDVAALAGVSLKTVSRVVNREAGVSSELIARVDRAAAQLDYRPNLTASNLRRSGQRTATWGLLLEDVANPFSAMVHRGVEEIAREHDVAVIAASLDEDPEREHEVVAAFSSRRVDGLIIAPTASEHAFLQREIRSGIAIVFVDRPPLGVDVDSVTTDNREAAAQATAHLIYAGHTSIGFVGDFASISTANERYLGYLDAMAEAGVRVNPTHVVHDVHDEETAARAVTCMLAEDDAPTALFTAQNLITMGAVRALRSLGRQQDIALVGFDDFTMADLLDPAITVMAQDSRQIGRLAATLLLARIADPGAPIATHVVPSRLIERGSGEIPPRR